MSYGTYFDYERGALVPNTLKVLQDRHEEFKLAIQESEKNSVQNLRKIWVGSLVKSKADSLLTHLDHILMTLEMRDYDFARYIAMKACVLYEAGTYLMNKHVNGALTLLRKAHELLWPLLPRSEIYWLYFATVTNLAIILKEKEEEKSAVDLLEESIQVYDTKPMPAVLFACNDLFSLYFKIAPRAETKQTLEKNVTQIFQLLIKLFIGQFNVLKYITCEHFLLRRELEKNILVPHEWIERAVVVAKILTSEHDFRNARHHLAVATKQFIKMVHNSVKKKDIDKASIQRAEEALSIAWIKYGLFLMIVSKESVLHNYCHGDPAVPTVSKSLDDDSITKEEGKSDGIEILMERVREKSELSVNILPKLMNPSKTGDEGDVIKKVESEKNSSIIDSALLQQEICAKTFSDTINKKLYFDLSFPGQDINDIEKSVPRSLIETPAEGGELFLFLLPWIEVFKKIIDCSNEPLSFSSAILDLNELLKNYAFFQPEPKQQYELHKERQLELERLSWILKREDDPNLLSTEIIVTRELSIVHYQLTHMNLRRMKELEEEEAAIKVDSSNLIREMLLTVENKIT